MDTSKQTPALFPRPDFGLTRWGDWRRDVESMFDDIARRYSFKPLKDRDIFNPSVDIAETAGAIDITAELPGCDAKDVDISVTGRTLRIRGEKKAETEKQEKDWHVTERSFGSFERAIPLGFDVEACKVEASFEKGVLKVHVPKPAAAQAETKKIAIKT